MRILLLALALSVPSWGQTYNACLFTGNTSPNVFKMATSNDGATWTNKSASWTTATSNVNAPTCIYYKGQWFVHVAAANDSNYHLYTWYVASLDYPTGAATTIFTGDWHTNISGLDTCFAGEWFIDDDGSLHLTIPCTTDSSFNSGWKTYETHPTNDALTTWSNPVDMQVAGTQWYDSTVIKVGSTYLMWVTNLGGTNPSFTQCIGMQSSSSFLGPYSIVKNCNFSGWTTSLGAHEGPNAYPLTSGSYYWRVMIEKLSTHQMYYADCNTYDFSACTWTSLTAWTEDQTYRHGTVRLTPLSPAGAIGVTTQ